MKTLKSYGVAALVACLLHSTVHAAIKATGEKPDPESPSVKVVDLHTHVFNVRDLPLQGILESRKVPWTLAAILTKFLLGNTPENLSENKLREVSDASRESMIFRSVADEPLATFELEPEEREQLRSFLQLPDERQLKSTAESIELSDDETLVALVLLQVGWPDFEELHEPEKVMQKAFENTRSLREKLSGLLRFVRLMQRPQHEIVEFMKGSAYPDVDLFIHHLMDMEKAYADRPENRFAQQSEFFTALDRKEAGRIAHFSAYDPFRRDEALPFVQMMWNDSGALGFKVYPPSGYSVTENDFPKRPSWFKPRSLRRWKERYGKWNEADLDANLDAFFAWAASKRVPLFTHCTPYGFEAEQGYGAMANPQYWEKVLEKHPDLILCFGHAGGEVYWFSDPADDSTNMSLPLEHPWQFGRQVRDLCLKYPFVYASLDYHTALFAPDGVARITSRLSADINLDDRHTSGEWKLGDRLTYGTDWHMMHQEDKYRSYLPEFIKVFDGLPQEWLQPFFAGNAVRFLHLKDRINERRFTTPQKDAWGELTAAVDP